MSLYWQDHNIKNAKYIFFPVEYRSFYNLYIFILTNQEKKGWTRLSDFSFCNLSNMNLRFLD